ncbi:hypothetical protein ERJ75_001417100 [Trypanosoma vivax]|uniref:C2CD3 N-terminal C2 domain-containing protein n=1 Tax=Trypanosoma vivax (strain Y486) TaxID=1055687 RepID=G0TUG9_TRYVY|nr:hypothetical protein TRVL_08244 [Trypanosoma vivax]KAH8607369.1 hypothetical protein ERJ75_001417100 [Trypanosoma vivax]CCC47603.1 conserved hypothetical protein [Trypanosoma vivax Y486]
MQEIYGSSLPPGTEAPTYGALRIRVEKLLLKEDVVDAELRKQNSSLRMGSIPVSVDHCAVGLLFWGESQPTCQCVPTTPGKPRGVTTLVYPLKVRELKFESYILEMQNSCREGVQIVVFVPTSYSGRHKPVHVGSGSVDLTHLKPSRPVNGWFTIKRDLVVPHPWEEARDASLQAIPIEVGKVKLTFTVRFFQQSSKTRTASAPPRSRLSGESEKLPPSSTKRNDSLEDSSHAAAQCQPSSPVVVGVKLVNALPQPEETPQTDQLPRRSPVSCIQARSPPLDDFLLTHDPQRAACAVEKMNTQAAVNHLIQKGFKLREKMTRALSPSIYRESVAPFPGTTVGPIDVNLLQTEPQFIVAPSGFEHLHGSLPLPPSMSVTNCSDSSLSNSSTLSTQGDVNTSTAPPDELPMMQPSAVVGGNGTHLQVLSQHSMGAMTASSYVEIDLSQIAFSSGEATLGMEEMRVGIRLSKDVKTDEPVESYSSYVHRVPLSRGAEHHIIIGFPVRAFSEDKSRMVISFYRVLSAPASNPPRELLLPAPATAKRILVDEKLLGMCIVGLHTQRRHIVLHNPVTGEDPTQASLCVRVRSNGTAGIAKSHAEASVGPRERVNLQEAPPPGGSCPTVDKIGYCGAANNLKNGNEHRKSPTGAAVGGCDRGAEFCSSSESCRGYSSSSSARASPSPSPSSSSKEAERMCVGVNASRNMTKVETEPLRPYIDDVKANLTAGRSPVWRSVEVPAAVLPDERGQLVASITDRFRMHVAICSAKELPLVALCGNGHPLVSKVAAADQLANGVRSAVTSDGSLVLVDSEHRIFEPPSTFFVVEDIYSATDISTASRGVVPGWYVETATSGEYDRTRTVPRSQSPSYEYECILSLPQEAVFLRQMANECGRTGAVARKCPQDEGLPSSEVALRKVTMTASCLREMRLTLWHLGESVDKDSTDDIQAENKFWARASVLGECSVDLRSLRFLKVLDGWYRINAIGRVDDIVGYARVSVRLL